MKRRTKRKQMKGMPKLKKPKIKTPWNPGQLRLLRATNRPDTRQRKPPPQLQANALLPSEKAAT